MTHTLPSPILPVRAAVDDGVDDALDVVVVDEDLDPHLRHEVDGVLRAPVDLGVAALAAEALHLGDGHARGRRASFSAAFTSSSLNGLMIAVISFMPSILSRFAGA